MTFTRVTQNMMSQRSLQGLHVSLDRLAKLQEQLSTGRVLNRPSDSPTDTTAAMRVRASLAETKQFARNAADGQGWLTQIDSTLQSMVSQTRRARDLALQGVNAGSASTTSREALALEVEQLRDSLISLANTRYLDRPVFGGVTTGTSAYDSDGQYVGVPGQVDRAIAEGVKVRVDVDAATAFGPQGANLFDDLESLSGALRSGDTAGVRAGLDALATGMDRLTSALADVGSRANRIDRAVQRTVDDELALRTSLSEIENVDLPKALVDLHLQEMAYQAALGATARVMQPSLMDFLR